MYGVSVPVRPVSVLVSVPVKVPVSVRVSVPVKVGGPGWGGARMGGTGWGTRLGGILAWGSFVRGGFVRRGFVLSPPCIHPLNACHVMYDLCSEVVTGGIGRTQTGEVTRGSLTQVLGTGRWEEL